MIELCFEIRINGCWSRNFYIEETLTAFTISAIVLKELIKQGLNLEQVLVWISSTGALSNFKGLKADYRNRIILIETWYYCFSGVSNRDAGTTFTLLLRYTRSKQTPRNNINSDLSGHLSQGLNLYLSVTWWRRPEGTIRVQRLWSLFWWSTVSI